MVDKFEDVLVVQSLALGIDRWKELILDLIKKISQKTVLVIRGVYERSDAKVRKQEGMPIRMKVIDILGITALSLPAFSSSASFRWAAFGFAVSQSILSR